MDTIMRATLCSEIVMPSPSDCLTKFKNQHNVCQDDIGPNEPLLHHLLKYSLTTPMHPAAVRTGLENLDWAMQGKLSGQKLQQAVQDWCRKDSILIHMLLNFTLPFVKRQGFSRCVSVMRLKMVYHANRSQILDECSGMRSS